MRREVRDTAEVAELSNALLVALGEGDVDVIRSTLDRIPADKMKDVLTTPSSDAKMGLQTPFMRAASRYINDAPEIASEESSLN